MHYRRFLSLGLIIAIASWPLKAEANLVDLQPSIEIPGLLQNKNAFLPEVVEPLRLELNLSQRQVTIFRNGKAHKTYPVGIGRIGWETPSGTFKVEHMRQDPEWMNPFTGEVIPGGAWDNPLGRRWIGFWTDGSNWVGFHGTNRPDSVGSAASHGCVRMHESDIEELYELIAVGTPVKVIR